MACMYAPRLTLVAAATSPRIFSIHEASNVHNMSCLVSKRQKDQAAMIQTA